MKKIFLLLVITVITSLNAFGQAIPKQIDYQGVLKNAAGVIVPDGNYPITFKIYNDPTGGTALWTEAQVVAVANGIFSAHLGSITPITTVPFDRIHFLGITIGADPELLPRTMLTPTPYSFMSLNVMNNTVVKSLNSLKDDVNLVAGSNITITPSGNNLTISAAGGGGGTIGGSGTTNYIPVFTNSTTLGNSMISQSSVGVTVTSTASSNINPTLSLTRTGSNSATSISFVNSASNRFCVGIRSDGKFGISSLNNNVGLDDALVINSANKNIGIGTSNPSTLLHISGSSTSLRLVDGSQASGKVLVSDANGNATWQDNSLYNESGVLNASSVNLSSTWSSMGDFLTFIKNSAGSTIEVIMNTRILAGTFSGATGVRFEVRIDGASPTYSNDGSIRTSGETEFISIFAVFTGLSSGSHTVSVWGRTNTGTSTGALLDPGGWGGKIITKETF